MSILLIAIGLIILVKGADIFVDGSSEIAKRLNVSERIIGLTLVAFGTSFPELSVSVIAAVNGSDGLAVGNVVGSNIYNICGVLGILALIRPIVVSKSMVKKDIPMNILTSLVLFIILFDSIFAGKLEMSRITRSDGLIFLLFFAVFLYYTFYAHINGNRVGGAERAEHAPPLQVVVADISVPTKKYSLWKNIVMIVLGLGAVLLGGDLVVRGSVSLAQTFGLSDTLIGLTIVSIGTSLPELITGIVAIRKGKDDIAVGNVVGSGMFNVLFILGVAAVISPITLTVNILIDVILLIAVSVFLFFVSRSGGKINRREGLFLLTVYIGYFIYIIHRG
jgi:cation:H+ antiporter